MRRMISLIIICSFLSTTLTACYDAREIDDAVHVVTIGIDKGVSDKWRLTIQFPTMKGETGGSQSGMEKGKSSGGGSDDQDGYSFASIDAPSFFSGINMINASIPRRLSFMHTQFLIFSEEIAKEGLIGEFLAPIIRYREIRRSLHVIVSKNPAMDFIKENKLLIGTTLSKGMEVIVKEPDNTGFFPHVTLIAFYNDIKSTYHQSIALLGAVNDSKNFNENGKKWGEEFKTGGEYYAGELPRIGGSKIEYFGTALFDGDKMAGELNGDETRLMLIARGEFKRGFFTISDPKKPDLIVPLDIRQSRSPDVKIKFAGGKPVIHLKVQLEGDILAVQSRINYESPELKPVLENAFKQYIKSNLDKLMEKCKSMKTDIFNFGDVAAMHFNTIQEWDKYNWLKQFENAEVSTEVGFIIRRPGTMLRSSPIVTTKGKE